MSMESSVEAARIEQLLLNEKVEITKPRKKDKSELRIDRKVRKLLDERFTK